MNTFEIILIVLILVIVIDIYVRIFNMGRHTRLLLFSNEIVGKILAGKNIITRAELDKAREEAFGNMSPQEYESLKKDLRKINVDIEK